MKLTHIERKVVWEIFFNEEGKALRYDVVFPQSVLAIRKLPDTKSDWGLIGIDFNFSLLPKDRKGVFKAINPDNTYYHEEKCLVGFRQREALRISLGVGSGVLYFTRGGRYYFENDRLLV